MSAVVEAIRAESTALKGRWLRLALCIGFVFLLGCPGGGSSGGSDSSSPGGGTPGLAFASSWTAGLGNTLPVLSDAMTWSDYICSTPSPVLRVVPGASVGWTRSANVLRSEQVGTECGLVESVNIVPERTDHWGRMYFRNDEEETTHFHVVTYQPLGDLQVAAWAKEGMPSGVRIFIKIFYDEAGNSAGYPFDEWSPGTLGVGIDTLPNGVWFRYEWMMEYVRPDTYRIYPRVYDMSGNLLYDSTNYFQGDYPVSGSNSLQDWYDAGNTFGLSDARLATDIGLGNEGPAGGGMTGGFWYHADFAISLDDWIGP